MDPKKESQELLAEYAVYFQSIKGLKVIFLIDFSSMTLKHKLIESEAIDEESFQVVKNSALLFKKSDLNVAYLEGKERLFVQRLKDENFIVVLITDKTPTLGSIFRLLDHIPQ